MDWESWLRKAADPPSQNEDDKRNRIQAQVQKALSDYEPLKVRPYRVYVKGSYANNTNVRLDYDVDIAVEYYGYFYTAAMFDLAGATNAGLGLVDSIDAYKRSDFKANIRGALDAKFGADAITAGKISYRVRHGKTTLPADVVPCWEYRRYGHRDSNGNPVYVQGSKLFPPAVSRSERNIW